MDKKNELKKFMSVEIHRIDFDKWMEGIRIQSDPGDQYIIDWIDTSAAEFRVLWEKSCCQYCCKHLDCGHHVRTKCNDLVVEGD